MNNNILKIISANYLHGHTIRIVFNNNITRDVDFFPFLTNSTNHQIRDYLSIEKFKTFKIVNNDLMWEDFDLLFPINDLYSGKISA